MDTTTLTMFGFTFCIALGDLRAANILVSQGGGAFVSDFGLARLEQVAETDTITSFNAMGACRWMAPG